MKYPIPEAVLGRHIAVVGETGSGKTHDTKSIVEHLVAEGHRVCVLDTIKSDWWGVISSASGKKAGLPFRIIGGPRGHVPLHAGAGKILGELVAKGKLPLSIIDMADFDMGEPQAFFVEFAKALWKHVTGVLYLVIEEAHEIAPKERAGFGKENMAVYWAKRLATGSRTKGIRLIVATQRTQALHNAVLGSCGVVMAHSLSYPADQKPVMDWLNNNIKDKALRTTIAEEMGELPTGTAWVACPKEKFFEKVHFPLIKTFDNSATPDKDAAAIDVTTVAVDQDELRSIIGDAVKEAEANDPVKLKAELADLRRRLAKAELTPAPKTSQPVQKTITLTIKDKVAHERALTDARTQGGVAAIEALRTALETPMAELRDTMKSGVASLDTIFRAISRAKVPTAPPRPAASAPARSQAPAAQPAPKERKAVQHAPEGPAGPLTNPQKALLKSLAWWRAMGHEAPTRAQAAAMCKWQPNGSNVKDRTTELKRMGLVEQPEPGTIAMTAEGVAAAPEPDTGQTLVDSVRAILTGPQDKVFMALRETRDPPGGTARRELAETLGWEPEGSNIKDRLTELVRLEIAEYVRPSFVRLQDWVQ